MLPGKVLLYYVYEPIEDAIAFTESQEKICQELGLTGRIRVAHEGLNGTLYGSGESLDAYVKQTSRELNRDDIDWKLSESDVVGFDDLQVKKVKELVSMNRPDLQYDKMSTATHLSPEEFQKKCLENTPIIDVRNSYEYDVGHFKNAINPDTRQFSEFQGWFEKEGQNMVKPGQDLLLYCTGGIRCEKASIVVKDILKDKNVNVYQLRGGIHRYLENIPASEQVFLGRNFVFDKRRFQPSASDCIGECVSCCKSWEEYSDERRCAKCRVLVLSCDSCFKGKCWCKAHAFLNPESVDLEKQRDLLVAKRKDMKPRTNARKRVNRLISELEQMIESKS